MSYEYENIEELELMRDPYLLRPRKRLNIMSEETTMAKRSCFYQLRPRESDPRDNIGILPEEIMENIFNSLSLKDLKNVRLVNKKWHKISFCHSLVTKYVTVLSKNFRLLKTVNPWFRMVNVELRLKMQTNIRSKNLLQVEEFWKNHGRNVINLKVEIPGNSFNTLLKILLLCPRLKHLSLVTNEATCFVYIRRDFFDQIKLPFLQTLELKGDLDLTFPLIQTSLDTCPRLKSLTIYVEDLTKCVHYPDPLQEIDFVRAVSLQDLSVTHNEINSEFINRFTTQLGPQLKRLFLNPRRTVIPLSLKSISDRCVNLENLTFYYCPSESIPFHTLRHLTTISLLNPYQLTDASLSSLSILTELSHFEIGFSAEVTYKGIIEVFGKKVRPMMRELRLESVFNINNKAILAIAPNLPNLKVLEISNNSRVTPLAIRAVAKYCPELRCLILRNCSSICTSVTFIRRINRMRNLVHLDIRHPLRFNYNIKSLISPSLKVLLCHSTPSLIHTVKKKCPALKYVLEDLVKLRVVIGESPRTTGNIKEKNVIKCCQSQFWCYVRQWR